MGNKEGRREVARNEVFKNVKLQEVEKMRFHMRSNYKKGKKKPSLRTHPAHRCVPAFAGTLLKAAYITREKISYFQSLFLA